MARSKSAAGVRVLRVRGAQVSKPVPIVKGGARSRGAATQGARKRAAASDIGGAVLLQALESQELTATHEFTIAPARPAAGARRGAAKRPAPSLALVVDVGPSENAVVLVEQDGEYTWHFPPAPAARVSASRPGAARRPARKQVTIPVTLTPGRPSAARVARRGMSMGGALRGRARAVVLKFIARTAAGVGMRFLERNVRKGLIVMDGDNPDAWRRVSHIDDLNLPGTPRLRILLWVHGTFSSTAGSFGALAATPDGRLLMKQARERYDAVIGFDHATLSETPHDNAIDLVERLGRFKRSMQIDAVTYSRGGLVFRSLVEQILPASKTRPGVGQVVFVGVPNHGTLFADPAHWKTLVDVYTNLAMGAFGLLQRLPAAAPTANILSEIVSGLGAFVKYLAEVVITDAEVPGLAAQAPNGPFVRALNETGDGQPLPDDCRYLAVTSNFDPKAAAADGAQPTGLAASFLGRLTDGLVDRLMDEAPNDLVVNTGSMTEIDPDAGDFIDASLDFTESPVVYHTVYFAQAGVAQQLRGWLMDDQAREGFIERHGLLSIRPSPRSAFTRIRFHESEGRHRAPQPEAPSAARSGARKRPMGATPLGGAARRAPQPNAKRVSAAAAEHLTKLFGERVATEPMNAADMAPAAAASRAGAVRRGAAARAAAPGAAEDGALRPRAYAPRLEERSQQCSTVDAHRRIQVVSFRQMHRSIPIFGSRATVELDDANNLVAARAKLGRVEGVTPTPGLSVDEALSKLLTSVAPLDEKATTALARRVATVPPPLTFFFDRPQREWHLAYVFSDVPAVPASWRSAKRAGEETYGKGWQQAPVETRRRVQPA